MKIMANRFVEECILFFRVLFASLVIHLGLRFFKLRKLLDFLDFKQGVGYKNMPCEGDIFKILDFALRYSCFMRSKKCLRRSLLLFNILRSYGYPAKIHFGIQSTPVGLKGHCWITIYGKLLFDQVENIKRFDEMLVR